MFTLPKAIYKFNGISLKVTMALFMKIEKNNPKICVEPQKTSKSQSNLGKEEQTWRHHTS